MRKIIIIGLLLSLSNIFVFSYERREAQIYTNGDYELELDWMQNNTNIYPYMITIDKNDNTYVIGQFHKKGGIFTNGAKLSTNKGNPTGWGGWFILKSNSKGEHIWLNKIDVDGDFFGSILESHISNEDLVLVGVGGGDESKEYKAYINDQEKFTIKNGCQFVLKLSSTTGEYQDILSLDEGGHPDPYYNGYNIYKFSEDGSIYLMTYIGKNFISLDNDRLKTKTRSHGGADVYIAKINPDFTLAWDFAFGGDKHDVPWAPESYYQEYYDSPIYEDGNLINWMALKEDTLIVKMSYFSDEVDIDPSENEEILKMKWMNEAVIARYYAGGDFPVLLDYKKGYTENLPHDVYVAENGTTYTLDMKRKTENTLQFDNRYRYYKLLNNDLTTKDFDSYQYQLLHDTCIDWTFTYSDIHLPIHFDKSSNMYIGLSASKGLDPIDVKLNNTITLYSTTDITKTAAIVKYDSTQTLHWGIMWPISFWAHNYIKDDQGGIYIIGSGLREKDTVDLAPSSDLEHLLTESDGMFLRYVETYRIKSAPAEHGHVIAPEKLVHWGGSTEVSVVPDAGYEVERVSTSRGEELTKNASGKYVVENVTDVVTVSATFKISSAVDDIKSDKIKIYPNPVEDILRIEENEFLSKITILDVQGREIMTINDPKAEINVSNLASGVYTLKAESGNENFVKQFIKK